MSRDSDLPLLQPRRDVRRALSRACEQSRSSRPKLQALAALLLPGAFCVGVGCDFDTGPLYRPRLALPSEVAGQSAGDPVSTDASLPSPIASAADSQPLPTTVADAAASDAAIPAPRVDPPDASRTEQPDAAQPDAANPDPIPPQPDATVDSSTPVADLDAATPSVDAGMPGSSCPAGRYSGEFTCTAGAGGFMPVVATTQVTLDLRRRSSPRVLTISDSRLMLDLSGWIFSGNISGELDCTTDVLRADIVDGMITAEFLPSAPTFTGLLDGQLDRKTQRISGAWSISTPTGSICAGTWQASLTP